MTPAELAHVNGHFDLANKLHSMHVDLYKETSKQHVYDYIQQSNYQIPPPPRPVHIKPKNNPTAATEVTESLVKNNQEINFKTAVNNNNNDIVKDPYGTMRAEKKLATPPGISF